MAITPQTVVNDDGTGTTGTVWNAAFQLAFEAAIDAAIAEASSVCQGRLTLTTAVPVTTADVTGATSIKWTPYTGNRIALYSGTVWTTLTFVETSLALGTITAALPYDVFAYNNSGTLALEALAWTSATVRATALVLQDGVLVKTGATTRRYLGTFYTTSTTTTEDSAAKRFLWNYYNRVRRVMAGAPETTDSWTYTTAVYRQARASTANQVDFVLGVAEVPVTVDVYAHVSNSAGNVPVFVAIGEDSTTTTSINGTGVAVGRSDTPTAGALSQIQAHDIRSPAIGRHFYAWLEISTATGTTTWYGDNGGLLQSGIVGTIDG